MNEGASWDQYLEAYRSSLQESLKDAGVEIEGDGDDIRVTPLDTSTHHKSLTVTVSGSDIVLAVDDLWQFLISYEPDQLPDIDPDDELLLRDVALAVFRGQTRVVQRGILKKRDYLDVYLGDGSGLYFGAPKRGRFFESVRSSGYQQDGAYDQFFGQTRVHVKHGRRRWWPDLQLGLYGLES